MNEEVYMQCLQKPKEDFKFPGTVITVKCELLCGCFKLNPRSLEQQPVDLTANQCLLPHSSDKII